MMIKREEFTFPSADGKTKIQAYIWVPETEPRAILQIEHGMSEHVLRYDEFARDLCEHGVLVAGQDLLGHGKSVTDPSNLGYFAEKDGNTVLLKDIQTLEKIVKEKYPAIPYFLLGHSMGSFKVRQYMAGYGNGLSGAIVMGTAVHPGGMAGFAAILTRIIALFKGWKYRSPFIWNLACGSNNERFGKKEGFEWLSRRKENVDRYNADPLCGFMFTLNGFYNLFESLRQLADPSYVSKMKKDLPVLIVSGTEDPVGKFGTDIRKLEDEYRQLGMKNVTVKLYEGDRHEILNEDNRAEVRRDIIDWIEAQPGCKKDAQV